MVKNNKEELVAKIIDNEWDMFHNTSNVGGRHRVKKTGELLRSIDLLRP